MEFFFTSSKNKITKWIYSYYFKAAKDYKDIFKLMRVAEIKCFNSYLYFYYINNRINLLTIIVDLNRVPFIIKEGQSYIELPKKL